MLVVLRLSCLSDRAGPLEALLPSWAEDLQAALQRGFSLCLTEFGWLHQLLLPYLYSCPRTGLPCPCLHSGSSVAGSRRGEDANCSIPWHSLQTPALLIIR